MNRDAVVSIVPQLASGGCTARPKKLKPASASKTAPVVKVICTMSGAAMLGRICLRTMRTVPAPTTRAART